MRRLQRASMRGLRSASMRMAASRWAVFSASFSARSCASSSGR